ALPPAHGSVYATLRAWVALRKGATGEEVLDLLPNDHLLKRPLAQTLVLAKIRSRDLPGAAALLKRHIEPGIESAHSPELLAQHYVEVARLLYQAGYLDEAERYYARIPSGASSYLEARQEMTWIWLRKGDQSHLRGELKTLGHEIFAQRFSP